MAVDQSAKTMNNSVFKGDLNDADAVMDFTGINMTKVCANWTEQEDDGNLTTTMENQTCHDDEYPVWEFLIVHLMVLYIEAILSLNS